MAKHENTVTIERRQKLKLNLFFHLDTIWLRFEKYRLTQEIKKEIWKTVQNELHYAYGKGYKTGRDAGIIIGAKGNVCEKTI